MFSRKNNIFYESFLSYATFYWKHECSESDKIKFKESFLFMTQTECTFNTYVRLSENKSDFLQFNRHIIAKSIHIFFS